VGAWNHSALVLLCGGIVGAAPPPSPPVSPQEHINRALAHVVTVNKGDVAYVRYVSFWDVPEKDLWAYARFLPWWLNQMSFERAPGLVRPVEGTNGRLWWIDLRDFGWNRRAWDSVAARDPFAREPWVFHRPAEALRQAVHTGPAKPSLDETIPLLALVNGSWLLRETLETRRSASYYDLLFAHQRFPGGDDRTSWRTEWRTVYHGGGDYRYPDDSGRVSKGVRAGTYQVELRFREHGTGHKGFVDFPRDVQDWEKAFGIDKLRAFAKETRIDLDFGAVVAGGRDDPDRGSIVALNNRLLVIYQGPLGWAMRTYDVGETSKDKDYSETLIFKGGKFYKGDGADAVFDAGELLAYLPNGGQAGLLINGQGKRIEVAGADFANDTADKRLNQGVRNYGSCITCHGGGGGFIVPRDVEEEDRRAGIKRKFKDKEQAKRYAAFFEEWTDEAKGQTLRYERLVRKTTQHPYDDGAKAWTGSDVAKVTGQLRDAYDDPVNAERGARTLGVPLPVFKYLCSRSPNQRPLQLLQGRSIPSVTWEKDTFRQTGLLLDVYRERPEVKKSR
jgi:hypothetical protein